jgi:glycosyltransferase involved in cell wall biosynthesis
MMRVLFINRCYYPDVEATGQLLAELCADLAQEHDITVLAGRPNLVEGTPHRGLVQREAYDGVKVLRVRNVRFSKKTMIGRLVGISSYVSLSFFIGLLFRKPDVIIVGSDPPLLEAMAAFLRWWHRCPLIFYLQDLHPEAALVIGRLRPGLLTRMLRWTTQVGLRRSDRVIVLGEDMKRHVLARGIDPSKLRIVSNWADTKALRPVKEDNPFRARLGTEGRLLVMYSGNMGLSQNLEQVLVAARSLANEPVSFLFVGGGADKTNLMARAEEWGLCNVQFLPYQPKDQLSETLSAADLHLITQRKGMAGLMVPSKLYSILASGTPYLAAIDTDSGVAQITRTEETGLLVEPDSPEKIAEAIRWCVNHRDELREMGRRGRLVAESRFDRSVSVARFNRVLAETAAPAGGAGLLIPGGLEG